MTDKDQPTPDNSDIRPGEESYIASRDEAEGRAYEYNKALNPLLKRHGVQTERELFNKLATRMEVMEPDFIPSYDEPVLQSPESGKSIPEMTPEKSTTTTTTTTEMMYPDGIPTTTTTTTTEMMYPDGIPTTTTTPPPEGPTETTRPPIPDIQPPVAETK